MRKILSLMSVLLLSVSIFAGVIDEFNDPSSYSRAMGGSIYAFWCGAKSISYNPAGLANGNEGLFFSHVEHFLGVIRNEFLSGSLKIGNLYAGGAVQYTYPVDEFKYNQYKIIGAGAYRIENTSFGVNMNLWTGSDVESGFSVGLGAITKYDDFNFALVAKNLFSSITWSSTPNSSQNYNPEIILSGAYFNPGFVLSSYANINSREIGIGADLPLNPLFSILGGYRMTLAEEMSKEVSVGMKISYYSFNLDIAYVFKESLQFGNAISPFYVSITYDFLRGSE